MIIVKSHADDIICMNGYLKVPIKSLSAYTMVCHVNNMSPCVNVGLSS